MMAPITEETFNIESSEVPTVIITLFAGNETAKTKILPFVANTNARRVFRALMEQYEEVGL